MLVVSNISKQFRGAESHILKHISFTVNAGERVGLIGPNGSGKSTLLRIIMGLTPAESGSVQFTPPDLRVGYLAQGIASERATVEDVLFPQAAALHETEAEVERLADRLAANEPGVASAYDEALERLMHLSTFVDLNAAQRALAQLELEDITLGTHVQLLSGGQKTRLVLASFLLREPELLLLDEPTNHLDIEALEWLETWLAGFPGGALIVSHDRTFLDRVVTRVVALNTQDHTARSFVGNYSDYMETLHSEQAKQWSEWKDQQDEIARLQADARATMTKAQRKEHATIDSTQRRYAKKVAKRAKAKEKRLERYVESDDRVEKPKPTWNVKMEFDELGHIRGDAVQMVNLSIGYLAEEPLLADLNLTIQGGERVAVIGPNGHGKSTLLKTIVGQLPSLAGTISIGKSVQVGYLAQEQEILDPRASALTTIQAEASMNETEARSFLHFFLFSGDDSLRPTEQLSFGERARLMLARLVARGANLLVMDEPLNHLDLPSREKFERALRNYPGSVLTVTHDRYFVGRFATTVWHVANGELDVELHATEIA